MFAVAVQVLYASDGRIMVWYSQSIRPGLRPSQFSVLFSYMFWHIQLKFCVSLYLNVRKIKFECHQFPLNFARVKPLLNFWSRWPLWFGWPSVWPQLVTGSLEVTETYFMTQKVNLTLDLDLDLRVKHLARQVTTDVQVTL